MPDNYARRRFALPVDLSPDDVWCVTLWVPGHTDYVDQLAGLIKEFGDSKNYERDATKIGAATVARTWRRALDFEPPRIGDCAQPVTPPVLDTQAQRDDYAAAIIEFMRQALLAPLLTCAAAETPCSDCVDGIMIDLADYGGGDAMRAAIAGLCAAVSAATPTEITAAQNDCVYTDEFTYLAERVGHAYGWLNEIASWLYGWIGQGTSILIDSLNNAASVIGGNGIHGWMMDNSQPVVDGGAGFGGGCAWFRDYYPGHGLDQWTVGGYPSRSEDGVYTSSGWACVQLDPPEDDDSRLTILSPLIEDGMLLTVMEITYIGWCDNSEQPYLSPCPTANETFGYLEQLPDGIERTYRIEFAEVDTRHCSIYYNIRLADAISEISKIRLEGVYA